MENSSIRTQKSTKRLNIDRNMIGILSVFAFLGICLVITIIVATSTLSALRGFGSMQTHWTEIRKEATLQLVNYVRTREPRYLGGFDNNVAVLDSAQKMRYELNSSDTDNTVVRQYLQQLHVPPADRGIMITTYERFHRFSDFKEAVNQWTRSDELILQMKNIATKVENRVEDSERLTEAEENLFIEEITGLDRQLTEVQYELAAALGSGTRFLNTIVVWIASSLGVILLLTGGLLSFRFLRSIKNWRRELAVSEQQYRSLFEQNPNVVFSIDPDGNFIDGNRALENIFSFENSQLQSKSIDQFFEPSEVDDVYTYFNEGLKGNPQKFQTVGLDREKKRIYFDITMLPIYVDNEITGAYGIAQDISKRKRAEKKIREQLEEKTHLLSEIHDRVKNNLALILSLMHLQKEMIENPEETLYMESTISRIHSIAIVHEQLYHNETFSSINMDEYIRELSSSIQENSGLDPERYRMQLNIELITLSINEAIPLGLLLNEMLLNAFNYAFEDLEKGVIKVKLSKTGNNVTLRVSDNGVGLPENISLEEPKSLGFKLIKTLIEQLNATYSLESKTGTAFTIQFTCNNHLAQSETA